MVNPVGPAGDSRWGLGGKTSIPPGPPLPADDPWVKSLAALFPNAPLPEIQAFAGQFKANMYASMNAQISQDLKRARAAAQKFKESIEGNG